MSGGVLRTVGKKHFEQLGRWAPTLSAYGVASSLTLLYFTDWKLVLQYVPFYRGAFEDKRNF